MINGEVVECRWGAVLVGEEWSSSWGKTCRSSREPLAGPDTILSCSQHPCRSICPVRPSFLTLRVPGPEHIGARPGTHGPLNCLFCFSHLFFFPVTVRTRRVYSDRRVESRLSGAIVSQARYGFALIKSTDGRCHESAPTRVLSDNGSGSRSTVSSQTACMSNL